MPRFESLILRIFIISRHAQLLILRHLNDDEDTMVGIYTYLVCLSLRVGIIKHMVICMYVLYPGILYYNPCSVRQIEETTYLYFNKTHTCSV